MGSDDGQLFVKNLAHFIRTHEKALANALQLKRQPSKSSHISSNKDAAASVSASSAIGALAAALSLGTLNFTSQNVRSAKLTLTPHHLFYLLSRFEEFGICVGPMNVRLENIHTDASPANYVSFLNQAQRSKRRSDRDSIHSVSSVRSVMSSMSSVWSAFRLSSSNAVAKSERAKAAFETDLKYIYSAFTKIPCLRLSPDHRAPLISGYEEYPFDTAVPLIAFKNVSALEIVDVDFRSFFGWDRLAEQLRSLTVKRANVDDPTDLLVGIVLDDMDKRRRRSSKVLSSPVLNYASSNYSIHKSEVSRSNSAPSSPPSVKTTRDASPKGVTMVRGGSHDSNNHTRPRTRAGSRSPSRPSSSRQGSSHRFIRVSKTQRSGSGSSNSSTHSFEYQRRGSSSNLLAMTSPPPSKWRFLKHLSLADNSLTFLNPACLSPLAGTLSSLDLSSNLFMEVPESLAILSSLRALNLSNCMIESLHSLSKNPLPAITAINLRANRLQSLAGIEKLLSLERIDLRENKMTDPTELARLTGLPNIREVWVANNPFVKTHHSSYRVTTFNLFRKSPGYTEDIIIDGTGPGYGERRQLVERVAEPESVPVVKPAEPEVHSDLILKPAKHSSATVRDNQSGAAVEITRLDQIGYPVGSQRKRKGGRRRVVELAHEERPMATSPPLPSIADASPEITSPASGEQVPSPAKIPIPLPLVSSIYDEHEQDPLTTLATKVVQPPLRRTESENTGIKQSHSGNQTLDLNFSGDLYRQKLEAIKQEAGTGWLNVLSEDGWNDRTQSEFDPAQPPLLASHPIASRAQSHGIISSGRTLG